MSDNMEIKTGHFVNVQISSTLTSFTSEKRFPKDLTVGQFKVKKKNR